MGHAQFGVAVGGAGRLGERVACVDRSVSARVPTGAPPVRAVRAPNDQTDPDRHHGRAKVVMDVGSDSLVRKGGGQLLRGGQRLRRQFVHVLSVAVMKQQVNGLVLLVVRVFPSRISVRPRSAA